MNTVQISLPLDGLLDQLEQFDLPALERVIQRANILRERKMAGSIEHYESKLVEIVNTGMPLTMQQRMAELVEKRESHIITNDELVELLTLTDEAEQVRVDRMDALIKLAALRETTVDELIEQYELA